VLRRRRRPALPAHRQVPDAHARRLRLGQEGKHPLHQHRRSVLGLR
jgi:hypothetical protein